MLELRYSGTDSDHHVKTFFPGLRDSSPITTGHMDFLFPLVPRLLEGLPTGKEICTLTGYVTGS